MSSKNSTLRDLLAPLRQKYFISGEINTRVTDMATTEARLKDLAAAYGHGRHYALDGFSAEFPDWHFNVRASNTEPLLRLNLEAATPALMAQKRDEILALIRKR
jgi:phosphomannomutase